MVLKSVFLKIIERYKLIVRNAEVSKTTQNSHF